MALSNFEVPIRSFVLFALAGLVSAPVAAQSTQTVSPDDPVYLFVDKLVAARLVDTIVVGQRMMSRLELGRIIGEARVKLAADTGWMGTKLGEYARQYPANLTRAPHVASYGFDAIGAESPSRGIEADGNGAISVAVNPLLSNQLGRPLADGATFSSLAEAGLGVTRWLAVNVRSRLSRVDERGEDAIAQTRTEQFYARALWRNAALLVGRDYVYFGQGNSAGLTSSLNPRAVPQVRLSTDRPSVMPGWLRLAGPTTATFLLADLGLAQHFPHTRLFTYKISSRPHPRFEIGTSFAEQVGGKGSPPGTFLQKAGDAFPLLDALFLHRNFLFSNKFVGVDLRYTLPGIRGLQFYAEGAFDDFDFRRTRSVFTEDAAYVWGASLSCFNTCGPVHASAEYHVTGLRFYTHAAFQNGYTIDRKFIGDPLGPRGKAGYGSIDIDRGEYFVRFDAAYESRSGNKYGAVSTTPDDSDFQFVLLEQRPTERRWRSVATLRRGRPASRQAYRIGAGVERVEHFAHIAGRWRTNWMTQMGVEYRPMIGAVR